MKTTPMQTIRTPKKREQFLEALGLTCNVTKACDFAGLGRASVYEWRDEDQAFANDWKKALEMAADLLEEEAVRRAKDGVDEAVYQGGKLVGTVRKYSDTLLIFLLKGAKPKKYSDRMALSGSDGAPLQIISTIPRPPRETSESNGK